MTLSDLPALTQPLNMSKADLHIHTTCSDGVATVREVLAHLSQHLAHIKVIAITDHDCITGSKQVARLANS